MRNSSIHAIALGGMLAAVAMAIMCLGGLIPVATFICPLLCTVTGYVVFRCCGSRIAWAWYGTVSILVVLFSPDKEAAAVYCFLGYYPYIRNVFTKHKLGWIGKLAFFNGAVGVMYSLLIYLFGMNELLQESREVGFIGLGIMLLLGNATFLLLDKLLAILDKRR